jgi:exodeoxyribonuclease VIII
MVDIETMGTSPQSPVLTIGAVLFDPHEQNSVQQLENIGFLRRIDLSDALRNSGGVEPDTLKWWLEQDDKAIKALVTGEAVSLKQALIDFRNYCIDRAPQLDNKFFNGFSQYPIGCILWAKSPDFDCKILENACKAVGEQMPMKFYQYRCVRTLQDLCWPEGPSTRPIFKFGTAHDARADAVNQALMVQAGYKELGLNNKQDVKFDTF